MGRREGQTSGGTARAVLASASLISATVAYASTSTALSLFWPRANTFMPLVRSWARLVLGIAGVRVEVSGLEQLPREGAVLYMTNHQSNLDTLCLFLHLAGDVRFVAKQSLKWVPFLGWSMAINGFIFIDRHDRTQAIHGLERAVAAIRAGRSVLVFPEGTRSRDGQLGRLKKGPFHLATAARVPIVPVALDGSGQLMPIGHAGIRAGLVKLRFGAPIPVDDEATPEVLMQTVHAALAGLLAELRR